MRVPATALLMSTLVLVEATHGQTPRPVGGEFQVNTYTTSNQWKPSVAVDADGDFVVVWSSGSFSEHGPDGSYLGTVGQRFDPTGVAVESEFPVNTYTTSHQWRTSVGTDSDGNFVVVWQSYGSSGTDTDGYSIQGQRFDSEGSPLGSEFQVNTYSTSSQWFPSIAVSPSGEFVVVWESNGSNGTDTDQSSIQGQRFDATGNTDGSEFQVNSYTTSRQANPSVGSDAAGDFTVVWDSVGSSGTDPFGNSVQGQRFTADGTAVGDQFQVNGYTTGEQTDPIVGVSPTGGFAVVWNGTGSGGTDLSGFSIQGRLFDSTGDPLGIDVQINTYTTDNQYNPWVTSDAQGNFVVVWRSLGSDGTDTSSYSIQGQQLDSVGDPRGSQFQVNTYTSSYQYRARVSAEADGDFIVVWVSDGSTGTDTSLSSIQGQRFETYIFTDGFESGDTSAWSRSVP